MGACVIVHLTMLTNEKGTFLDAIKESPPSLFTGLINVISIWSILGLSGFHTYLLAINQTTNEDIKGTFNSKLRPPTVNPYSSHNFFKNCCSILCAPEPPSLLDGHGLVNSSQEVVIDADLLAQLSLTQSYLNNCQPMENPCDQPDILTTNSNNVNTSFDKGKHNSSSRSWNGGAAEKTAGMSSCEELVRNGGSQRAVRSGNSSKTNCSTAKSAKMSTVTPIQSTSSNSSQHQQSAANPPLTEERLK